MKVVHPNLLFFGPPGSGKSTHARLLAAMLNPNLQFVDMSRICKLASAFCPAFANLFAAYSGKGELVPNEDILPHFRTYMETVNPNDDGIAGSGLFRTPEQVQYAFEEIRYFKESCAPIIAVRIKLSPEDAVNSCRARAAQAVANHQTPRKTDLDDETNAKRVTLYEEHAEPVFEELRRQCNKLTFVDVPFAGTVHDTFSNLTKQLGMESSLHLRLVA